MFWLWLAMVEHGFAYDWLSLHDDLTMFSDSWICSTIPHHDLNSILLWLTISWRPLSIVDNYLTIVTMAMVVVDG